jgi:hypothetical protein
MAWDQSRPVPWRRLVRDWLFYVAVMVVFLAIFGQLDVGVLGGVLASVVGHTALYVSGGAEHQGPAGGGPVAAIVRMEPEVTR